MRRLIFSFTMLRNRVFIIEKYGREFRQFFRAISKINFESILPRVPDIGESVSHSVTNLSLPTSRGIKPSYLSDCLSRKLRKTSG